MELKLFKSKKADWQWWEIMTAVLAIAGLIIFIYWLTTGSIKFGKSTGCTGAPTGYTGERTLFCSKKGLSCPEESVPASETAWSYFSGGCGIGRICCFGTEKKVAGEGGKGAIELRLKDETSNILSRTDKTVSIQKGVDTNFNVKGTEDIMLCQVNLIIPMKDADAKKQRIIPSDTSKEGETCNPDAAAFSVKPGGEQGADEAGAYKLEITGYNSNKEVVDSKSVNIGMIEGAAPETGAAGSVIFNMSYYNDNLDVVKINKVLGGTVSINEPIPDSKIYYDLECSDCILVINDAPQNAGSYSLQPYVIEQGINKFEIQKSDGTPMYVYYVNYARQSGIPTE